MKLGPTPLKCPHCGKWARSPEEVKIRKHQSFKRIVIISIITVSVIIGCIIIPSLITKSLYPLADFKADMKFTDFLLDENYTGHENCNITFMAIGGYHYNDFNDLSIRLNFPDFCHIDVVKIHPEITDYEYLGWYNSQGMHHIDYSTMDFEFDPHVDGVEYCINLKITWDYFDIRFQKYESSLNHHEYIDYVLPDQHETFNHLTDFHLNGYNPEEYRFNMYINEKQVDWNPIWEGRDKW